MHINIYANRSLSSPATTAPTSNSFRETVWIRCKSFTINSGRLNLATSKNSYNVYKSSVSVVRLPAPLRVTWTGTPCSVVLRVTSYSNFLPLDISSMVKKLVTAVTILSLRDFCEMTKHFTAVDISYLRQNRHAGRSADQPIRHVDQ